MKRKGEGASSQSKARRTDSAGGDDEDTITACEISKNRKVSVRKWRGQVLVDIREYWYKDSQCLPGKKGISLTMEQWNVLEKHIDDIDSAIQSAA